MSAWLVAALAACGSSSNEPGPPDGASGASVAGAAAGGTNAGGAASGGSAGASQSGGSGSTAAGASTAGGTAGAAGASGSGGDASGAGTGGGPAPSSACGVNPALGTGKLQMENLCRGVVAVRAGDGNFVSWRLLGYEAADTGFNVYRDGLKVNPAPIVDSTNYVDAGASATAKYTVRAIASGVEQGDSADNRTASAGTSTWPQPYLQVPLKTTASYRAGDTAPGDLNGDGDYELVVKEERSPQDSSNPGVTGQPKFAAYDLDGTFLWRVDLGINIRESEHTTSFLVYDLDGDGSAELVVKTAPGTKDGKGDFLHTGPAAMDDDDADYRNGDGKIVSGPEYLTVFRGKDGVELATIPYHAPYSSGSFGDNSGNRSDRYNASVAFLDATGRPSAVMQRGYYARTTFGAYNYRDGKLELVWKFDTQDAAHRAYAGKGVHSLMVADGDGDGRQEIIPGGATIGPDGKGVCAVDFYAHGDAIHVGDLVLERPGLEVFQIYEAENVPAYTVRDLMTCELIVEGPSTGNKEGPARGAADDISPESPGGEIWGNGFGLSSAATGARVGAAPGQANFLVWWDGDESRELLSGNTVTQYDDEGEGLTATGCTSINGSKSVPNLSADLFGDWREEIVFSCGGNLRIYTTTAPTKRRIPTLMHDPQYRMNVTSQNASYNQPPHTSFHIGAGMKAPPKADISVR
ncbi:MAG: rhamnogalacturonan lyase [Myxococcales bacterium]|nr:MAG: rhamnogalacturonan lyase [Myxococcales bacterium]